MYGYIYETKNLITNKFYIGQHKCSYFDPNYLGSGTYIARSISKYGKENFTVTLLEKCISQKHLDIKEQYYIKEYSDKYGWDKIYNITTGGRKNNVWAYLKKEDREIFKQKCRNGHKTLKYKQYCESTKQQRSLAQSERMMGHIVSDETKLKSSISNKGQKRSKETCNKMSQVWHDTHVSFKCCRTTLGKKCVTKNNICKYIDESELQLYLNNGWIRGNKINSIKNKGQKRSKETKKRISDALKGKPKTEEHKRKISETLKSKNNL